MPFAWKGVTVFAITSLCFNGGCLPPPPKRLSETPPPSASSPTAEPSPSPVVPATLAAPTTVANEAIAQFIATLSTQGASEFAQGIWVQSQTQLLANHQGTIPLPAASISKVATSLVALKQYGPDHRFETLIGTTGTVKQGVLTGDLVIQGHADPLFVWEDAIALANLLQAQGIRRITGNLVIVGPFYMNFVRDPKTAGELLRQGINAQLWPPEAEDQYQTLPATTSQPQLVIEGSVTPTTILPTGVRLIVRHSSRPVSALLKQMNQYSNNDMAEILAEGAGGAQVVAHTAAKLAGVPASEIQLVNGSGLALENRISPRAACGLWLAIAQLLQAHHMTIADIFAVIGQDEGILAKRNLPPLAVLKSGTLNGVSALAGALPTRTQGIVWFAILNTEGNETTFQRQQEALLQSFLTQWGTVSEGPTTLKSSSIQVNLRSKNDLLR